MIDAAAIADVRFALRTAAHACAPGRCDWYHGAWSVWRALGLAMAPACQRTFYRDALADVGPGSAILVSGSADHGMLGLVAEQLGRAAASCRFTVVDVCATPLALCERHAAAQGLTLDTAAGDILEYEQPGRFDVIVTHIFLGYFAPAEQQRLFARWHSLLRPGGRVVTVQRLRPGFVGDEVRFSASQKHAFVEAALARRDDAAALGLSADALRSLAETYAECFVTRPVRRHEDIAAPMALAGLTPAWPAPGGPPGPPPAAAGEGGPSIAGDAHHAYIVATKAHAA